VNADDGGRGSKKRRVEEEGAAAAHPVAVVVAATTSAVAVPAVYAEHGSRGAALMAAARAGAGVVVGAGKRPRSTSLAAGGLGPLDLDAGSGGAGGAGAGYGGAGAPSMSAGLAGVGVDVGVGVGAPASAPLAADGAGVDRQASAADCGDPPAYEDQGWYPTGGMDEEEAGPEARGGDGVCDGEAGAMAGPAVAPDWATVGCTCVFKPVHMLAPPCPRAAALAREYPLFSVASARLTVPFNVYRHPEGGVGGGVDVLGVEWGVCGVGAGGGLSKAWEGGGCCCCIQKVEGVLLG
jgi:hypothetical protein